MGGVFGVAAKKDCVADLFYGTDYHSHLGTRRGGMAVRNRRDFFRSIHDITNAQFRGKFENDLRQMHGSLGIGVISDFEDQPLIIGSHLGTFALATVGRIQNLKKLAAETFRNGATHFSEMEGEGVNPTELVATLINRGATFQEGIGIAQAAIEGSCSLLLLTPREIYAARDRLGRTPLVLGRKASARAVTLETCALSNLDYEIDRYLGPGEIVRLTPCAVETLKPPGEDMRICSFLWVYYGFPASSYEGINVETVRNRCGAALARGDRVKIDLVAGVPDSGTGHAIGYANVSSAPYGRPFAKYTPTWPRSFMPQEQRVRDLVAKMKLIPIRELIEGKRLLFCEDSIVRGTQLKDTIRLLYDYGAKEVHMRPACPPLLHGCKFLNFSRSKSEMDLAARRAAAEIAGQSNGSLADFSDPDSPAHKEMVERIRKRLGLTTLRFQRLDDLVEAIGLPQDKLCTYCWNGVERCESCPTRKAVGVKPRAAASARPARGKTPRKPVKAK
ncbi:MAG: amidophosphoribosyltransferase [Pirellulaceae bacterium]|nr:amidophosphoribosyltransferase [Pirellulaceae bacterium]